MKDLPEQPRALSRLPHTAGLPLVGSLPLFLAHPYALVATARERYGDIFRLDLGVAQIVALNSPRHAEHVLIDHPDCYVKGGVMVESLRRLFGNGLATSDGDFWRRQRRRMQPQFHRQQLVGLFDQMTQIVDAGLATWEAPAASGAPFDVLSAFSTLTMDLILRVLFGTQLSPRDRDTVSEGLAFALKYLFVGMATMSAPAWLPVPGTRRYRTVLEGVDQVVARIIAQHRREGQGGSAILSMLIDSDDPDQPPLSTQQIRDELVTLFVAGYETSAIALSWAVARLVQHPAVYQQARDEVDAVLGGRTPAFSDLGALPATRMIIQETLRLHPPGWMIPRVTRHDDVIDGYRVPAGTSVALLVPSIQRHADYWEAPHAFDPARFTPARSAGRHKCAWMPFGAGQRQCIGRDLALMESQLVLAMLLQRYALQPIDDRLPAPQLSTTLRPANVLVRLTRRTDAEVVLERSVGQGR